jgi:hypothetical protein
MVEMPFDDTKMSLRIVLPSDEALLYRWVNDKETKRNSRHPDLVVTEESHHEWFVNALRGKDRVMRIAVVEGFPVGLVRTGPNQDSETELCFTVDPSFRGKGIEFPMVLMFIRQFVSDPTRIQIPVKIGDLAGEQVRKALGTALDMACFFQERPQADGQVRSWFFTNEVSGQV